MKYDLNKRTVVLTGASGGFGREIAKRLILSHGCRVVGIGRREDKMAALKEELKDKKELFSYKLFDVSDRAAWTNFAENLDCEPSVLINCAGILPEFKSFEKQSEESVFRVTEVNYPFGSHGDTAHDAETDTLTRPDDSEHFKFVGTLSRCGSGGVQRKQSGVQKFFGSVDGGT